MCLSLITGLLICIDSTALAQNSDRRAAFLERLREARASGTLNRLGLRERFLHSRNNGSITSQSNIRMDVKYGNGPLQTMDVFYPSKKSERPVPILVFLHGGGWRMGDKRQHVGKGELYANSGIVFVSVNYGLAPQVVHPNQALDVAKAIKHIDDNAKEWGADPDQIYLMGHSAGAHLVDLVATNQRFLKEVGVDPSRIKGVISLDTASLDLLERTKESTFEGKHVGQMIEQAFGTDPRNLRDGSPTLNIHKGQNYPPFLMYCGAQRRSCLAQHTKFANQLRAAGGRVLVQPVPLSHRDINLAAGSASSPIFEKIKSFVATGAL